MPAPITEFRHTDGKGATLVVRREGSGFDARIMDGKIVDLDPLTREKLAEFLS